VLSPKPSRPQNYAFPKEQILFPFKHIILDSFVCPQSKLIGRFRESYSFGKATYKYIKQHYEEIDVVYANTWPLFAQYYMAKAAKRYGIPYYIHVQDIYPESYCYKMSKVLGAILHKFMLPIDKYVLSNAKRVIAISPSMIPYLSASRSVDASKFTLVRNWQDDKAYVETYKPIDKTGEECHIMYLGSINPTANVALIIKACKKLDHTQFRLSIIGNGPEKDNCISLTEQVGLKVSFNTVVPEQVAKIQRTANVLVLCLKKGVAKTATPSKLTAYMLSGRPIIASVDLDSDCANIIKEASCGLVVEPDNETALSNAIQDLSQKSVEELNEMGKAAFDYAVNHLSKERNLSMLINLITQEKK
jgi:glycosyltransferase involved in cell wall biosynthesis